MDERHACVDCRKQAPETRTEYTLISAKFGWRLSRRIEGEDVFLEWRCPECFAKERERQRSRLPELIRTTPKPKPRA